jgi:hypothetical protein
MDEAVGRPHPEPWNKGKLVGQKAPFKLKEIWAIRVRLQLFRRVRDLALFDLGIDSKLRACDLVRLKVRDICHGDRVAARAIVMQQKTSRPVQFIAATRSGQIPHSSAPRRSCGDILPALPPSSSRRLPRPVSGNFRLDLRRIPTAAA